MVEDLQDKQEIDEHKLFKQLLVYMVRKGVSEVQADYTGYGHNTATIKVNIININGREVTT